MNNVIIRELKVQFQTLGVKTDVLRDICMDIPFGKICGLIGRTGAGKTTLMRAIADELPEDAILLARDISFPEGQEVKTSVVLQNPSAALNPTLKIKMQFILTLGIGKYWRNKTAVEAKFRELLKMVGLSPAVLNQYPSQLSGGMCQRVNIALSLLNEPMMLILDEPTSALDAELRCGIMDVLSTLCRKKHIAILIISHDIELIQKYSDIVYVLENGCTKLYDEQSMNVHLPKRVGLQEKNKEILLTAHSVCKSFKNVGVLKNISFSLAKNECLGIVGHSGCGKSTLAKILCGLYGRDSGEITMANGCKVEMLFQDAASSLDPTMSVLEALNESRIIGKKTLIRAETITQWLDFFALPRSVLIRKCSQLSGGQRQLVALMRIMVDSPDIIILDEPTSSMDVFMQKQMLDFLNKLKAQSGTSYILISHDESVVSYMCDSILKL